MNRQTEARAQGAGLARTGAGRAWERAGLVALFLALLALCGLFPLTGDDWFREELGRRLTGPMDLLGTVFHGWRTYNGRILGNLLAYAAGSRRLLRELLRAAFLFGTVRLAALRLLGDLFAERPVPGGPARAAVFLLGLCGALFVEHVALYGVWAGAVLLAWSRWRGITSAPAAAFCAGTLLGALVLFLSPSYGLIWGGGAYSAGLWANAGENLPVVVSGLISRCPVLYLALTALGLAWFAAARRTGPDRLLAVLLAAGCGCFILCGLRGEWTGGEALAAVLWGTALWTGCRRWLPKGERRNRALFFLASAGMGALPLLAVSPIGPRCLYWSYVCLTIAAGNLLSALPLGLLPRRPVRGAALGLAAGALAFYLALFFPIRVLEVERLAALEEAVVQGRREVVLPAYPNGEYLWEGDTDKIGSRFYIQEPGDLSISFVPAEEWAGQRGEAGG